MKSAIREYRFLNLAFGSVHNDNFAREYMDPLTSYCLLALWHMPMRSAIFCENQTEILILPKIPRTSKQNNSI